MSEPKKIEAKDAPADAPAEPVKVPAWKLKLQAFSAAALPVLLPKRERPLVYILLLMGMGSMGLLVSGSLVFWRLHRPMTEVVAVHDEPESDEHEVAEGGGEKEGGEEKEEGEGEGEEQAHLGAAPFSKSIIAERDGVREEGYDYVEPEIQENRSLASLIHTKLEVRLGSRFASVPDISASLKDGKMHDGMMTLDLSFEVPNLETQREIEARSLEIRSMISSLASRWQKVKLMSEDGISEFKKEIFREMNHTLAKGKVTDVLFVQFNVR